MQPEMWVHVLRQTGCGPKRKQNYDGTDVSFGKNKTVMKCSVVIVEED
jgi:hypothetical protein